MNLRAVANGMTSAINPNTPGFLRISAGFTTGANGRQQPLYETPGAIVASIDDAVLTVSGISAGKLVAGQSIAGDDVLPGTRIISLGSGTGGIGTYNLNLPQIVVSEEMTTAMPIAAQTQDLSQRDIEHLDLLNVQGSQMAIYLSGSADAIIRVKQKGGDLVLLGSDIWLVTAVLEKWRSWTKVSATLQNGG